MNRLVIAAAFCLLAVPAFAGTPDKDVQAPSSSAPQAMAADNGVIDVRQADAGPRDLTTGLSVPITLRQPQVADDPQILAQADLAAPKP